jgi:hypothetical protein
MVKTLIIQDTIMNSEITIQTQTTLILIIIIILKLTHMKKVLIRGVIGTLEKDMSGIIFYKKMKNSLKNTLTILRKIEHLIFLN